MFIMRKLIFEYITTFGVGIVIGCLIGMMITFYIFEDSLKRIPQAYDNGYKKAQQECKNFTK